MVPRAEAHSLGSLSQSLIRIAVSLESQLGGEPHAQTYHTENPGMRALKVLHRDLSGSIVQEAKGRPSSLLSDLVGDLERDVLREPVFDSGYNGLAVVSG